MNVKNLPLLFVQAALVATATILALVVVTKYVAPIPLSISQTTTQKDSAFIVSGKSSVPAVPDKVEVTLGITHKEADIKSAQTNSNAIINTITDKLLQLGVKKEDIKTQNYSINPEYDYSKPNGGQSIIGYTVNINLVVSLTDFSKLNSAIDMATSAGANQVGGIRFLLSTEKEQAVRKEARAKAILDAKANAQELSGLAGMKLGRILNVSESQQSNPGPLPMMMAADKAVGMGGVGGTDVQPGSTDYNYSVSISYETL